MYSFDELDSGLPYSEMGNEMRSFEGHEGEEVPLPLLEVGVLAPPASTIVPTICV
jgi:hypothetical protein